MISCHIAEFAAGECHDRIQRFMKSKIFGRTDAACSRFSPNLPAVLWIYCQLTPQQAAG